MVSPVRVRVSPFLTGRSGEIEVDGRRLSWRSTGSGPPLLLVNGYAATGADWDPVLLMRLGQEFEVICPDNRGMGSSELGSGELTVDGMAADLEALLDSLEIARLPVAGWSMGGFVAQRLALRAPDRVAGLALLSTNPGGPEAIAPEPAVWTRLIDHSGTPRERATRLISLLFPAALAAAIDRQFGAVVAAAQAALSLDSLQAQERAMAIWQMTEQAAPGAEYPPVLIAHGEEDVVIPAANTAALAARWPAARVERFAGCGHAFMAQEPGRLADLIGGFATSPA